MSRRFTAVISKEDDWYVAYCVELGVVSQGRTIEEAQSNLKQAAELYVESFGAEKNIMKDGAPTVGAKHWARDRIEKTGPSSQCFAPQIDRPIHPHTRSRKC